MTLGLEREAGKGWKGHGRVEGWEKVKRAALQRGVATSLTDAVSAAHDQLDGVTRRPLSQ